MLAARLSTSCVPAEHLPNVAEIGRPTRSAGKGATAELTRNATVGIGDRLCAGLQPGPVGEGVYAISDQVKMLCMDECSPSNDPAVANMSGRQVRCVKFQKELPGLDTPPWPGDLGQRVFENVSAQAWKLWEDRQKMILNEYRLMPWQKEAQEIIARQMEDFFFGAGAALPPGYVPQQTK